MNLCQASIVLVLLFMISILLYIVVGGPRVELLTLCMKDMIKEEFGIFVESADGHILTCTQTLLDKNYYFAAGLLCGQ